MIIETSDGAKPHYSVTTFTDNNKITELTAELAKALESGSLPPSIGAFSKASPSTHALSMEAQKNGSFQYTNPAESLKAVFFKTNEQELRSTNDLTKAGASGLLQYQGSIASDTDYYLFSTLPAPSINLSQVRLCNEKPTDFYGAFDALTEATKMLAQIHKLGFVHHRFIIPNLILDINAQDAVPHLVLYDNAQAEQTTEPKQRENDLTSFIESVARAHKDCSHKHPDNLIRSIYEQSL